MTTQLSRLYRTRLHDDERGVAAVEFALVLPVLLLILLGIIQFGFLFVVQNSMTNAAREGARAMAVSDESGSALETVGEDRAEEELQVWPFDFDPANADINGNRVTVTVTIAMSKVAFADIFGFFSDGDLSSEVTMRKE